MEVQFVSSVQSCALTFFLKATLGLLHAVETYTDYVCCGVAVTYGVLQPITTAAAGDNIQSTAYDLVT